VRSEHQVQQAPQEQVVALRAQPVLQQDQRAWRGWVVVAAQGVTPAPVELQGAAGLEVLVEQVAAARVAAVGLHRSS
jgi:hypothetical protein